MKNSGPNDQKSWLHSDIYDKSAREMSDLPRLSPFKFGSLSDALKSVAKVLGQSAIAWLLLSVLYIVLVEATRESDQYQLAAGEIVKLICFTISVFLATRIFDDTNIQDMGLRLGRGVLLDFLAGFGIASLLLFIEFCLHLGFGEIRIAGGAWDVMPVSAVFSNLVICLVIFLFVGWSEELLSRGFHLRLLSKGFNRPLGILISSVIFSYLHHSNPDMTAGSYIQIFLFGIVCCLAFLRSGTLWLPMGIHAGWDFFVVVFWGSPISGLRIFHLMNIQTIPGVASSGFILQLAVLIIMVVLIYFYTYGRSGIKDW